MTTKTNNDANPTNRTEMWAMSATPAQLEKARGCMRLAAEKATRQGEHKSAESLYLMAEAFLAFIRWDTTYAKNTMFIALMMRPNR